MTKVRPDIVSSEFCLTCFVPATMQVEVSHKNDLRGSGFYEQPEGMCDGCLVVYKREGFTVTILKRTKRT